MLWHQAVPASCSADRARTSRRLSLHFWLFACLALAASTRGLEAQFPGAIDGTIVDALTRAPVEGGAITIVQTAHATRSDAAGRFHLRGLSPGVLTLRVERLGYATATLTIDVQNGQTARADVALEPLPLQLASLSAAVRTSDNATRLDHNAIEESGARTAGDAIRSVPGLVVVSTGPGSAQFVSIRGAPSDATLVLVDGVPLNDAVTGEADLSTIDAASITSITILRGAASARFGARAAAGVVLIETRTARSDERRLALAAGSLGARRVALVWARRIALPWTAGFAWNEQNGEFPFALPAEVGGGRSVRQNADVRSLDLFAATTLRPAGGPLDIRVSHESLTRGLPGRAWAPSPHARQHLEQSRASAAWRTTAAYTDAALTLSLAHQYVRHHDDSPPFGNPYNDTTHAFALELHANADRRVRESTLFGLGAQVRHLRVRSTALAAAADAPTMDAGVFVHGEHVASMRHGHLTIGAQLRADRDPLRDRLILSHSLTAAAATRNLALHLAHRSAFSPPTLGDRFFREGVGVAPNPDLHAERVPAEIEAAARWSLDGHAGTASLRVTAFRGDIRNMILWAPDFRFVWSPYNANVKRSGIEAALQFATHGGRVRAVAAWSAVRATYDRGQSDDSVQIAYRPRHNASLAAHLMVLATNLSAEIRYTGARNTAPTNVNRLPGFWTLDAAISRAWQLRPWSLTLDLRVDRILDETNALIFGFPEPGRRLSAGLRLSPVARPPS
jgi:iron complex outermembrane receptor protein